MDGDRSSKTAEAFENLDSEESKRAHAVLPNFYEDGHVSGQAMHILGEQVEAATAGSCATIMCASTLCALGVDAETALRAVLVLGGAGGVAYGFRQRCGEMWYARHYEREYAREAWELENYEQGEREEMVGLYTHKGLCRADAEVVIETMSRYPKFFVGVMMTEELQLQAPRLQRDARAGKVVVCYAAAATLPALLARRFRFVDSGLERGGFFGLYEDDAAFMLVRVLGILGLASIGMFHATVSRLRKRTHCLENMLLGILCAVLPLVVKLAHVVVVGASH
ncbi:VIT family-domain-containing protein [Pelagophyceae sp. CCMP2097]|nr:VIT family-domain-containing protein [Pelagophyceae sp. CCMP2097]